MKLQWQIQILQWIIGIHFQCIDSEVNHSLSVQWSKVFQMKLQKIILAQASSLLSAMIRNWIVVGSWARAIFLITFIFSCIPTVTWCLQSFLFLQWQWRVIENNMRIVVCMYMSAEVKYMWKLEFPDSRVYFYWNLSNLLGNFMLLHFYFDSSGSEKIGHWGWPHLIEIKLPGENWWNK